MELADDLTWPNEIVNGDHAQHVIERLVVEWKFGVYVQVCLDPLGELAVGLQLSRIHSHTGHTAKFQIVGQMADPGRAHVAKVSTSW